MLDHLAVMKGILGGCERKEMVIDPYNKLIDRNPGDNMVDVSKQ